MWSLEGTLYLLFASPIPFGFTWTVRVGMGLGFPHILHLKPVCFCSCLSLFLSVFDLFGLFISWPEDR